MARPRFHSVLVPVAAALLLALVHRGAQAEAGFPLMHVGNIAVAYQASNGQVAVRAQIPILDQGGQPVPLAAVQARWTLPDASTATCQAQTNTQGLATCRVARPLAGRYRICVTGVSKTGYQYAPKQNVETCDYADVLLPDLSVTTVSTSPAHPVNGKITTVSVTVRNGGTAAAGPFRVDWYLDPAGAPAPGQPGDLSWNLAGLKAGSSRTLTASYVFQASGPHSLYAQADTLQVVTEANEGNNTAGPVGVDVQEPVQTLCGSIAQDTTLYAQVVYVVTCDLTVEEGATLAAEQEAVVKFGGWLGLTVKGTLSAQGADGKPVVFTSLQDDSYGGDTNGDGSTTTPQPGDWHAIQLTPTSTDNRVQYGVVAYGGQAPSRCLAPNLGSLWLQGSSLLVDHTTVEKSWTAGIYAEGDNAVLDVRSSSLRENDWNNLYCGSRAALYYTNRVGGSVTVVDSTFHSNYSGLYAQSALMPVVTGNTFTNNEISAATITFDGGGMSQAFQGNSGSGNGVNGVVLAGTVAVDTELAVNPGFPYAILDLGTFLTVAPGAQLTLPPGLVFKFSRYNYVDSDLVISGTLTAVGTEAEPVVLTSFRDDAHGSDTNGDGDATSPAAGDWHGIRFAPTSSNNHLEHVLVTYGGSLLGTECDYGQLGTLWVDGSSLVLAHSSVQYSAVSGVWAAGANSVLGVNASTFYANAEFDDWCGWDVRHTYHGVYYDNPGPGSLSLTGSTFDHNRQGLYAHTALLPVVTGNTFTDNPYRAATIAFDGGGISPAFEGNTGSGNGLNGLAIWGTVTQDTTFAANPTFPYASIDWSLTVTNGATLTFPPGLVYKLRRNYDYVGLAIYSTLKAEGDEENPVILTSFYDDRFGGDTDNDGGATAPAPGDWHGVQFNTGSTGSELTHVLAAFGGFLNGTWCEQGQRGILYAKGGDLALWNSTVEQSYTAGVAVSDDGAVEIHNSILRDNGANADWCAFREGLIVYPGTATVERSQIHDNTQWGVWTCDGTTTIDTSSIYDNGETGVYSHTGGVTSVHNSNIYGNAAYGACTDVAAPAIDATDNWWGDATGPYDPARNPEGLGNAVCDKVDFVPWLTAPVQW